jgi:hypothetical protein
LATICSGVNVFFGISRFLSVFQSLCSTGTKKPGQVNRDAKFCAAFREILRSNGVRPLMLPPHSPNLNAFAERWVRSVKEECLAKVIPFGEPSLRRALNEFVDHYHGERNHQGKENKLLFQRESIRSGPVHCRERLGGLLKYYVRAA